MIEVSTRYLPAALAMILLAIVPVAVHSYGSINRDDCADPAALARMESMLGVFDVVQRPEKLRGTWLEWTMGRVQPSGFGVEPMEFRVVRSLRPRRIYLDPTSLLNEKVEPDEIGVRWIDAGDVKLPIHTGTVFHYSKGAMQVASWLYVYRGRPVEAPFRQQLASALPQLFEGTTPLTIFLISGYAPRHRIELMTGPSDEWLVAAWHHYTSACAE